MNLHPDLKQSCPQKKEPLTPSLVEIRTGVDNKGRAYLLHVGHSRREGGLPLGQEGF